MIKLSQNFLKSNRDSHLNKLSDLRIKANIPFFHLKGKLLSADNDQGKRHADRLSQYCGQRRPRHVHMKNCHEQQIPHNVGSARNCHKNQRKPGISHSPENTADHIIGHDKQESAAADLHIYHRQFHCLCRRLHQQCQLSGENQKNSGNRYGQNGKKANRAANHPSHLFLALLSDISSDQNRDSHRKAGHGECYQIHDIASGRYSGKPGRTPEPPYHQNIYRAIHGL